MEETKACRIVLKRIDFEKENIYPLDLVHKQSAKRKRDVSTGTVKSSLKRTPAIDGGAKKPTKAKTTVASSTAKTKRSATAKTKRDESNDRMKKPLKRTHEEAFVRKQPTRKAKKNYQPTADENKKKERKIKEPNRKIATVRTETPTTHAFTLYDLVMVKIPSYSIWPARIVDVLDSIFMVEFFGTGHV